MYDDIWWGNNCFSSYLYLFRLPLCKPGKNGEPGPLPPDLKEGGGGGEGGEDRPALKKGGGGRRGKKGKKGGQLRLLQERCAHCQELYTEVGLRIGASVADPWHFGVDPVPDPLIHASN